MKWIGRLSAMASAALLASALATAAAQVRPQDDADEDRAVIAYEKGDYATSAPIFRRLAQNNATPNAHFKWGMSLLNGYGVQKDIPGAARYFKMCVDKGDTNCMNELGLLYATGQGVSLDQFRAEELFTWAANLGHALAKQNLADLRKMRANYNSQASANSQQKQREQQRADDQYARSEYIRKCGYMSESDWYAQGKPVCWKK
jgi:TPR repeat protein